MTATGLEPRTTYLGFGWKWGRGLVRIVLETSNLARKYTHVVSKNTPFSNKAFLILLISAFFWKKSTFLGKKLYSKQ